MENLISETRKEPFVGLAVAASLAIDWGLSNATKIQSETKRDDGDKTWSTTGKIGEQTTRDASKQTNTGIL